ncbi:MAG: tol-pal system protein YbgF, partial [Mesorhizobium sp.]
MHFRSVLSGTLALLLVSSVAALAGGTGASGNEQQPPKGGFSFQ